MLRVTGVGALVALGISSSVLLGCPGGGGGPPATGRSCSFVPPGGALPDTRTVEVGEEVSSGGPDTFVAYAEGGTADMIFGGQGASMVVPAFRVAAIDADEDRVCFEVSFTIRATSGEWEQSFSRPYRFDREGDFLYGGTVQQPISAFGLEEVEVEATVVGEDFSSSFGPVTLTLE